MAEALERSRDTKPQYGLQARERQDNLKNAFQLNRSCDEPKGNKVMVSIVKTKVDKPDRKTGFYTLMYDYGIDEVFDLVEVAMKYGIVNKSGAWFNFCDIETGEIVTDENGKEIKLQGLPNLIEFIKNDEVMLDELREQVMAQMGVSS